MIDSWNLKQKKKKKNSTTSLYDKAHDESYNRVLVTKEEPTIQLKKVIAFPHRVTLYDFLFIHVAIGKETFLNTDNSTTQLISKESWNNTK